MEGYDDVRPGSTTVAEWNEGGDVEDFTIETPEYGMDFDEATLGVEDVAGESAAITEAVLAGERDDAFADAVAVNAALRLYADEAVGSIEDGIETAREVIASGAAADRLDALRAF
jgi:anthranilate phosphoribosyltransferase